MKVSLDELGRALESVMSATLLAYHRAYVETWAVDARAKIVGGLAPRRTGRFIASHTVDHNGPRGNRPAAGAASYPEPAEDVIRRKARRSKPGETIFFGSGVEYAPKVGARHQVYTRLAAELNAAHEDRTRRAIAALEGAKS